MIKDIFHLKKNAWHMKLITFIWGFKPQDFSHMCPYFWLVVGTIVCFPIIAFVKLIIKAADYIEKSCQIAEEKWFKTYMFKFLDSPEEQYKMVKMDLDKKKNNRFYKFFYYKLEYVDYALWHKINDQRHEYDQSLITAVVKDPTPKENINKILKVLKPFTTVLFYIMVIGFFILGLWGMYHLILLAKTISGSAWIKAGGILTVLCIGGVVMFYTIIYFDQNPAPKFLVNAWKIISYPFKMIARFFKKIGQVLAMIISDNCPAIKWD